MRRANRIHVKGSDIPDLAENFSELQERLVGTLEWNWSPNADTDLILLPSSLRVKFVHPTIHLTFSLIGVNPGETFNGEVWLSKWGSLWGGLLLVIMTNNLTNIEKNHERCWGDPDDDFHQGFQNISHSVITTDKKPS